MPRKTVPLIVDEKYHVYNRGVDKRTIFLEKKDYVRFYMCLDLFNSVRPITNFEQAKAEHHSPRIAEHLVSIDAYALLPNHFHLIISPLVEGGLGEFLRRVCAGYTSYFNAKRERSGALFQGTFQRTHIASDGQYRYLFAYVNENHTVHGVEIEREVCHSSSLHYQGIAMSKLLTAVKGHYDLSENIALAQTIRERRAGLKVSDLLES